MTDAPPRPGAALLRMIVADEERVERLVRQRVAAEGKSPACAKGCRMTGLKCPDYWCEVYFQEARREIVVCVSPRSEEEPPAG